MTGSHRLKMKNYVKMAWPNYSANPGQWDLDLKF